MNPDRIPVFLLAVLGTCAIGVGAHAIGLGCLVLAAILYGTRT
jgi:hypothetical protein